jgi:hypothetical protein
MVSRRLRLCDRLLRVDQKDVEVLGRGPVRIPESIVSIVATSTRNDPPTRLLLGDHLAEKLSHALTEAGLSLL